MIASKIDIKKRMKVVMDCGNAAGAICAPEIFKNLNVDLTELYCDVDGTFPNHHPDPTVKENLIDLISLVKKAATISAWPLTAMRTVSVLSMRPVTSFGLISS